MRKNVNLMMEGARYHKDRPKSCKLCYYWKNRTEGCVLGAENCYYLVHLGALFMGLFGLVLLYCLGYILWHREWDQLIVWALIAGGAYGVLLAAGLVDAMLASVIERYMLT